MATVTKSIGTTGRDYSTITAWEADLDNGAVYASGDDAVGECYNDSPFDEGVTVDGGATVGLNSVKLSVAVGHRHDGTAGTGARMVCTADRKYQHSRFAVLEWLEFDFNGFGNNQAIEVASGANGSRLQRLLVHDWARVSNTTGHHRVVFVNSSPTVIQNCIGYDAQLSNTSSGTLVMFRTENSTNQQAQFHNTAYKVRLNGGSGFAGGVSIGNNNPCRNNIGADVSGTASGTHRDVHYGGTSGLRNNNLSTDDSADDVAGSGFIINATLADLFVSTVDGAEDLHLKTGSPAIDAGMDLMSMSMVEVEIDIDGRDRDAEGDTWDIGADEYVVPASQFARPASDVANGAWAPSTGTDLFAMLDETAAEDTDYIRSGASPSNDTAKLQLTDLDPPDAGDVILRVRHRQTP